MSGGALSQYGVENVCEWPGAHKARSPGVLEMEDPRLASELLPASDACDPPHPPSPGLFKGPWCKLLWDVYS